MLSLVRTVYYGAFSTLLLVACNSAVENIDATQEKSAQQTNPNLIALYTFNEGMGETIYDVSGVAPALNLRIDDSSATHWISDGLSIDSNTEIRSYVNADKVNNALARANAITAEAWIKPTNTAQSGPARVITLSQDHSYRNFMLGQSDSQYVVRLNTTTNSVNGTPEYKTEIDTVTTELTHVVFTWDVSSQTATIYLNGQLVSQSATQFTGDLSFEAYELILTNEINITDGSPRFWLGEIYLVALYDRALNPDEILKNYNSGH
jgi:hypothetical protein